MVATSSGLRSGCCMPEQLKSFTRCRLDRKQYPQQSPGTGVVRLIPAHCAAPAPSPASHSLFTCGFELRR